MSKKSIAVALALMSVAFAGTAAAQSQTKLVAPAITMVAPSAPRGPVAQMLTVTGTNFSGGLSINVVAPDAQKRTYAGSAIQSRRESHFQVAVVLGLAGAYVFTVTNPDGAVSEPFILTGEAPAQTPRIDAVLPAQLTKDPQPQMLTINGERFVQGLSVSLTDPIGTVFLIKGTALGSVTATSIEVSLTLEMIGDYFLMVTNPNGGSSNNMRLAVAMRKH
jgi:hypothetical protein